MAIEPSPDNAAPAPVTFYRLVTAAPLPARADRSAYGTLPTRAFRYCDAATMAASFGWHLFPPIDFSLHWDGSDVQWTYAGADDWYPLRSAQFPDFAAEFDEHAPEDVRGYSTPFLTALHEPGVVQVWTGLFARTAPGWSLLVRPPANLPRIGGCELYEGIVEADRWFGPVFTNVRITRTHAPVEFRADTAFLQVQPLPRSLYRDGHPKAVGVGSMDGWTEQDWDAYRNTIVQPSKVDRPFGAYAVAARKEAKSGICPVAHGAAVVES